MAVQAAKNLADSRLADPGLSAVTPSRELNVSVRTLQRAFKKHYGRTPTEYARAAAGA